MGFTYAANVTKASLGALLNVSGGHTGTLTFNTGTLSATAGHGLQFDNADGAYNFNGTTTLNGGDAGVDILNGSGGTFSFTSGAVDYESHRHCFQRQRQRAGPDLRRQHHCQQQPRGQHQQWGGGGLRHADLQHRHHYR